MLNRLVSILYKLPGIGKRSAEKLALELVLQKETLIPPLRDELSFLSENIHICKKCGNIGKKDLCEICSNPNRNKHQICIIKDLPDLNALEKTNLFTGHYFILNGLLSARTNITPETLNLDKLKKQIKENNVEELIFALPLTIDGKTTCQYIRNECPNIRFTELAHGLPIGGNLEFMDEGTIIEAFKKRTSIY